MEMPVFFLWLDPYLIRLYRLTGQAYADFFLGTLALAFLAVILGEISLSLASLAIRKQAGQTAAEAGKYRDLSLEALRAGDQVAYRGANKLANEAFSRSFFLNIGLSGAFLWPACLALAWMQGRFFAVDFQLPWVDFSLSYLGVFILLYVAAYLLCKRVKYRLLSWQHPREIPDAKRGQAR